MKNMKRRGWGWIEMEIQTKMMMESRLCVNVGNNKCINHQDIYTNALETCVYFYFPVQQHILYEWCVVRDGDKTYISVFSKNAVHNLLRAILSSLLCLFLHDVNQAVAP